MSNPKTESATLKMHDRIWFNLADEPWIEVVYPDGHTSRVGLRELFATAHEIVDLAVVEPLSRMAMWRFLIAFTYLLNQEGKHLPVTVDKLAASLQNNSGFDLTQVKDLFDKLTERLWLIHPEHPFAQTLRPGHLTDSTKPQGLNNLIVTAPGDSSRAWFVRSNDVGKSITESQAALALLTRWFYANSGNTTKIKIDSEEFGRTEGGRGLWGPRDLTHVLRKGPTLFRTLVSNLDTLTAKGTSIGLLSDGWFAPGGLALVRGDPLLSATISGAGTLLVDNPLGHFSAVVVGPTPLPKGVAKQMLERWTVDTPGGWADPHLILLRKTKAAVGKRAAKTVQQTVQLRGDVGDFGVIHRYLADIANPGQSNAAVFGVVNPSALVCGARSVEAAPGLEVLCAAIGGSATSVTYSDTRTVQLPPSVLTTDPKLAALLSDTLDVIYGDRRGRYRLKSAISTAFTEMGSKPPDVVAALVDRADRVFLAKIDALTRKVIEEVSTKNGPLSGTEENDFERRVALAALEAFDATVAGLRDSARYVAGIAKSRQKLRTAIPRNNTTEENP